MTLLWTPRPRDRRPHHHRPTPKPPIYVHIIRRPFAPRFRAGRHPGTEIRWTYEIITDRFTPTLLHGTAPTKFTIYLRAYFAVRRYNKHAEYHMICRTRRAPHPGDQR